MVLCRTGQNVRFRAILLRGNRRWARIETSSRARGMERSDVSDSRDGAKRRGVSLGPQASHILQRLYEPQMGPMAIPTSPFKAALSPVKRTNGTASSSTGGGGVLKPKFQSGMKKNVNGVSLQPATLGDEPPARGISSHQPPPTAVTAAVAGSLGSSSSVASFPVGVMHPSLLQVCAMITRYERLVVQLSPASLTAAIPIL